MDSFSGHLKLTYRYEGHILCWYINQIWSTKIKFKKTKNYKRRKNHNFCIHIVYIKCIYMNEWIIRCSSVLFCLFFCVLLIRWLTKAQIIHTLFNLIKSIHKIYQDNIRSFIYESNREDWEPSSMLGSCWFLQQSSIKWWARLCFHIVNKIHFELNDKMTLSHIRMPFAFNHNITNMEWMAWVTFFNDADCQDEIQ